MADKAEREFEIGKDEAWFGNIKRTYDEYQDLQLTAARRSQNHYDALMAQSMRHMEELHQDARRRTDLAVDRQWNIDEQGYTAADILQDQGVVDSIVAKILAKMAAADEEEDEEYAD